MCTAISLRVKDHYFGRNLDYEHTFGEKVTITPRNYVFRFRNGQEISSHYGIIGMALPRNNYPLYFDASNEKGLSMAGLNFPGNAEYMKREGGKYDIASFEFIPWVLAQCETVSAAEALIKEIRITDEAFEKEMPPSPLHWIISDKEKSLTVEQTKAGLHVYENPVGVLTNNPTFGIHISNLNNYMTGSPKELHKKAFNSNGIGIPGDLSSESRFVRACYTKLNSLCGESEEAAVTQFFHILYSVYQQRGCAGAGKEAYITNYTSCCNTNRGIYYYTTYNNSCVCAVDMNAENLNSDRLITYNIINEQKVWVQNKK